VGQKSKPRVLRVGYAVQGYTLDHDFAKC